MTLIGHVRRTSGRRPLPSGKGRNTWSVRLSPPCRRRTASINLFELAMWSKEVKGTIFGSLESPCGRPETPPDVSGVGSLKLDELITRRYSLGEINEGYAALKRGELVRGILDCTRL